jgi:ATP-dependent DNA helicase RecG
LSAIEFSKNLSLKQPNAIRDWLGRLIDLGLVQTKGKTKGVEYYLNPDFLRKADFKGKTNLKKIEDHRLKELIFQDLKVYPNSSVGDIHQRVGIEIPIRKIKSQLYSMVEDNTLGATGERKATRYFINKIT